jgi:hypothetical protein
VHDIRKASGKAIQRTETADGTVWTHLIIRERDELGVARLAGTRLAREILAGLEPWRKLVRRAAPQCVACGHKLFRRGVALPCVFSVVYCDDPRFPEILVKGVCSRCALANTDTELLMQAARMLASAFAPRRPDIH